MFKTLTEDGWVYCIGVYWLQLTNTLERVMRGGDGALCQSAISSTCCCLRNRFNCWTIFFKLSFYPSDTLLWIRWWQVRLCGPLWHASSRCGEAFCTLLHVYPVSYVANCFNQGRRSV